MNRPEAQLNAEERKRYQKYGYLVPRYRLPQDMLNRMRDAYDRLLAVNPGISSDFILGPHLEQPGAQGVRGSREWLEFATQPEILNIAAQLVEEDLILWVHDSWVPSEHDRRKAGSVCD